MNKRNPVLAIVLTLALVATACSANVRLPVTHIKTGPTQMVEILVPRPEGPSTSVELNLEFVAGDLTLAPGTDPEADGYLVSGTAIFNASEFEPKVETNGSSYILRTGDKNIEGVPITRDEVTNKWDLLLANTPMSLSIKTGPYNGTIELGGLSLEKLAIDEVGSNLTGSFSSPNQVKMSSFILNTGGSTMKLIGLANANFSQMTFTSGAGDYTLSFDGELQRDASVMIDSGVSTMNIIVPEGVNAQVIFDGGLTTINKSGGWNQDDTVYTLSGSGPTLSITVKMGIGTLNLRTE